MGKKRMNIKLLSALQDIVRKYSGRIALKDERNQITYQELDIESNLVSDYICKVCPGRAAVMLFSKPGFLSAVVLLGIIKSGRRCALPDICYTKEKLEEIIGDLNPAIIFADDDNDKTIRSICSKTKKHESVIKIIQSGFRTGKKSTLKGKREYRSFVRPSLILYTSGTTGDPKGVVHDIDDFFSSYVYGKSVHGYNEQDVFCSFFGSFSTVLTPTCIIYSLLSGASICFFYFGEGKNMESLFKFIFENKVTRLSATVSIFREFINFLSKFPEYRKSNNLRTIGFGGENFYKKDLILFKRNIKAGCRLVINYAMTEFLLAARRVFEKNQEVEEKDLYLEVLDGINLSICDGNGRKILRDNAVGEIVLSSRKYTNWYLKLVGKKGRQNPEDALRLVSGRTEFRTGDLGRWVGKNRVVIVGRKDSVVKINDIKISLDEIKNFLLSNNKIKDCLFLEGEDKEGRRKLMLYYLSASPIDKREIIKFLEREFPVYSILGGITYLKKFPLNRSNKIDRKKLLRLTSKRDQIF